MKTCRLLLMVLITVGAGCATQKLASPPVVVTPRTLPAELTKPDFIFAVLRHLHRWHMDATTLGQTNDAGRVEVWVRLLEVKTDEGDQSRFAELFLPGAGMLVDLKQSDHIIPERKLELKDDGFKVRAIHRLHPTTMSEAGWTVLRFSAQEVHEHLFQHRAQTLFPDAALELRLRETLAEHLRQLQEQSMLDGGQTFYAAPISPVCNELWIYWENQRVALRLATDGPLDDPRLWEQLPMHLRTVSLDQNVMVSPNEPPHGGGFVTRDWAGRLLYNCVVLGRKFTLPSPPSGAKP